METEKNQEILYLVFSSLLLVISLFQVVVLFLQEQSCSDPKPKTYGGKKSMAAKIEGGFRDWNLACLLFLPPTFFFSPPYPPFIQSWPHKDYSAVELSCFIGEEMLGSVLLDSLQITLLGSRRIGI